MAVDGAHDFNYPKIFFENLIYIRWLHALGSVSDNYIIIEGLNS